MEACCALFPKCSQDQTTPKGTSDVHQVVPVEDFLLKDNFKSLLPTIVLFIEQEPYSNVSMNLDVNFQEIHQENFDRVIYGTTMREEAVKPNGDTFQNSPIHLLFFEKVNEDMAPDLNASELTSMSYCRLKSDFSLNLPKLAYELEL